MTSCFHCGCNSFHLLFRRSLSAVMVKAVLLRPGRFDFLERILGTLSYELYQSLYLINKDLTQILARELVSWHSWKTGQYHTTVCSPVTSPSWWLIHFLAGVTPTAVTRLSIKDPVLLCNQFCLLKSNLNFSQTRHLSSSFCIDMRKRNLKNCRESLLSH